MNEKLNLNTIANRLAGRGLGGLQDISIFKTAFDFDKLRAHLYNKEGKKDAWDKIKWNDENLWNAFVVSGWMGNEGNVQQFINNYKTFMKNEFV
jgi:hypothetical protein